MIDKTELDRAAGALEQGSVVVVPTDTVYGVAVRPDVSGAVDALFALKGRARDKALPILGSDLESLGEVVVFDRRAVLLAGRYWPGPLTLVMPRAGDFDHDLGAGGSDSVAVRVPAFDVTRRLLELTGPLAVTSANPSGETPALTAGEANEMFGDRVGFYLDGGRSPGGRASTVVSLVGEFSVLRPGPLDEDELRQTLTS